jgi:1,4-dihydroxy-6-naphthoate synthase
MSSPVDAPLSLAISPCPNDTFAFHGWVHGLVPGAPTVAVSYDDIDVLNQRAQRGEPQVVKVSYGALPWLLDDYTLLRSGSALGRGCGPLVLSRDGTVGSRPVVAVPGERTTAYLLLRLWAAQHDVALTIVIKPFEQIMPAVQRGDVDAGLVIHESRFTYPSYGLTQVADLGDWWEDNTGLAIPLGAILARRDVDAAAVDIAIRASVELAWSDPVATRPYVQAHAQEMDDAVCQAHIDLYVNDFTADLGAEGFDAVQGLLERSAAAGLTPPVGSDLLAALR